MRKIYLILPIILLFSLITQFCKAQFKNKQITVKYISYYGHETDSTAYKWHKMIAFDDGGIKHFTWDKTGKHLHISYSKNPLTVDLDRLDTLDKADSIELSKSTSTYNLKKFKLVGIYHQTDLPEGYIWLYYVNQKQDQLLAFSYHFTEGLSDVFYYTNDPVNIMEKKGVTFRMMDIKH